MPGKSGNEQATKSTFQDGGAYERFMGRWSRRLATQFVEFAGIEDGTRVLDVGCGTGALTAAILAARARPQVVGVDPSEAFVEAARQRLNDPRARFEVGDAQSLPFSSDAFDHAASLLVLNFVPDAPKAAAEMSRVTRPGGVVAASVWDYERMTMLRQFWDAAASLDPGAAPARHESRMPLTREGALEALWQDAGLKDVAATAIALELPFDSFADYWEPFLAGVGPAGAYAATLTDEGRRALEQRLLDEVWSGARDRPLTLSARAWAVRGIVPSAM